MILNERHIPNNPRGIAGAVSIDAWRSPFDGKSGVADLFVDVIFGTAMLGGGDAPVRFRLALKAATIHVDAGQTGVLEVLSDTVHRNFAALPMRKVVESSASEATKSTKGGVAAKVSLHTSASNQPSLTSELGLNGEASGSKKMSQETQVSYESPTMSVAHRRTANGYAFDVVPNHGPLLSGMPWDPQFKRLSIIDRGMYRQVGDPPEPLVEVHVRRENLEIFDVQFTRGTDKFLKMHKNKQLIAVQYLKEFLCHEGLHVGDLSEPFALIKISDISPQERMIV